MRGRAPLGQRRPPSPSGRARCRRQPARIASSTVSPPSAARRSSRSRKRLGEHGARADRVHADAVARRGRAPPSGRAPALRASRPCRRPARARHARRSSTPSPRSPRRSSSARAPCFSVAATPRTFTASVRSSVVEIEIGRVAPRRYDAGVGDDDVEAAEAADRRRPRRARPRFRPSRRRSATTQPSGARTRLEVDDGAERSARRERAGDRPRRDPGRRR